MQQKLGKEYHHKLISSFGVLLEYITDLIKPEHSPVWRSIETATPTFKNHVICVKGYEEILQIAGYTVKKGTSLMFPGDVQEPDQAKLCVLAAELLMAKLEVEQMKNAVLQQGQQWEIRSNQSLSSCNHYNTEFHSAQKIEGKVL